MWLLPLKSLQGLSVINNWAPSWEKKAVYDQKMLANSVILSKIRAMGLLLSVMERSARPAKSQADTCGSSRQHDTAGGERQTAAHTRTEACCVRQQSKAVIGCDRRAVIRCTRINKFWSDPAQQTDAQKCTRTHTLIHTPH